MNQIGHFLFLVFLHTRRKFNLIFKVFKNNDKKFKGSQHIHPFKQKNWGFHLPDVNKHTLLQAWATSGPRAKHLNVARELH
jgi:hypothetical protein